jgi:putative transcriptional regulator
MKRPPDHENLSVYEQLLEGLSDGLAHARGERNLRTTTLPAPAPPLSRARVVAIRKKTGVSQSVFASFLNVPTKTLQSWEQGARRPKAGEARLLQMFEADPDQVVKLIFSTDRRTGARRSRPSRTRRKSSV